MSDDRLYNVLTAQGSRAPYGMTESLEISGKVPEGSVSVKCSDSLFLVKTEDCVRLFSEEDGQLRPAESFPEDGEADGFRTEISLATDVILPVEFGKDRLVIGETEFHVAIRRAAEKMLLIEFETGELMLFDTSRFLLYAFTGGRFICGYVEV